jgi:uncharacterized membrane protein YqjE
MDRNEMNRRMLEKLWRVQKMLDETLFNAKRKQLEREYDNLEKNIEDN